MSLSPPRPRPILPAMATNPVVLARYTQDLGNDIRGLARYVGNLEEGRSKVSVNSSLSVGDREDFFRFRVTTDQLVRLRTGELVGKNGAGKDLAPENAVRYQLLSPSGRTIADSDPNAGPAYDAWTKITSDDNLRLTKGSYTLRTSRGRAAVNAEEYVYSLTLRSGPSAITDDTQESASREFLTTERPAPPNSVSAGQTGSAAVLGLFVNVTA